MPVEFARSQNITVTCLADMILEAIRCVHSAPTLCAVSQGRPDPVRPQRGHALPPAASRSALGHEPTQRPPLLFDSVTRPSKSVTVRTGGRAISMENSRLHERAPTSVNVTVGRRGREYLTDREVERLMQAAKQNRSGHRDATAILVAYRHGLRASEVVALRWDDIDLTTGRLHVRRAKGGDASVHPISARESRALRKLLREAPTSPTSSSRNVAHLFPQPDISAWWPGRAWPRNSPFLFTPTCCGTPAGSSSPTTATTLGRSKPISATARSCPPIQCELMGSGPITPNTPVLCDRAAQAVWLGPARRLVAMPSQGA
jgi:Phage integrase family